MKKIVCNSMMTVLALVILLCQTALAADLGNLRILHTNDSHGFDMYGDGHNGMAVISELKKSLEKQGYDVLLLSAGDFSQDNNLVNFSKGAAAFDIFNATGYDAATLGNHEFDYGQDILVRNIKMAKFPVISCNVYVDATNKSLVKPSTIIKKGNNKIGIVGMSTPETIVSTNPKNTAGFTFLGQKELYACVQQQVNELKAAGCDVIIALGHMGSAESCMGDRSDDVLENVQGIDIFIDGHDHVVKNKYINGSLLAETGFYTQNIGLVQYQDNKWVENMIPFGKYDVQDNTVKKIIDKAQADVDKYMGQPVGENKVELSGARAPGVRTMEMPIGDFVADAFLWQARKANVLQGDVDIAIINGGGIRSSIAAGNMIRSSITGVLPYNNQLVVFKITGEKLLEIMECATCVTPDAMGAFPQVAGMKYTLDTSVPFEKGTQYERSVYFAPAKPGSRVTINSVGDKSFDPKKVYTVVSVEFVAAGGDSYGALAMPDSVLEKQSIGYIDVEAVENYIKEELHGVIGEEYADTQGRIIIR